MAGAEDGRKHGGGGGGDRKRRRAKYLPHVCVSSSHSDAQLHFLI